MPPKRRRRRACFFPAVGKRGCGHADTKKELWFDGLCLICIARSSRQWRTATFWRSELPRGGLAALRFLVSQLPSNLAASVVVTIHLAPDFPSQVDRLLSSAGPLRATFAVDNERLARGHIYLAPPARHLLVSGDRLQLGFGPRENHARPAIDPMLRSLAVCCGARAIGVVMTGTMTDGAAGLFDLKACGGLTIVQDPSDAAYSGLPRAALRRSTPDHVSALHELPKLLQELVQRPKGRQKPASAALRLEVAIAKGEQADMSDVDSLGPRSVFTCPECGGVMWEVERGGLLRYRCHIGHAYTAELVEKATDNQFPDAMARTLRTLKERVSLARRLEEQAMNKGWDDEARYWRRKVEQGEEESAVVSEAIKRANDIAARFGEPSAE